MPLSRKYTKSNISGANNSLRCCGPEAQLKEEAVITMPVTGSLTTKKEVYYAVLNLHTLEGKRKQKWVEIGRVNAMSSKDAQKRLVEICIEYDNRGVPYMDSTTAEYFRWCLEKVKDEVRPNTYRGYYGDMTNHIIPYFEHSGIKLQDLKAYQLEDFYTEELKKGRLGDSGKELSPTTVKHFHQAIGKALQDAMKRGLIYVNPSRLAKSPRQDRFKASFLNPSQLDKLVRIFKGSQIEVPVSLIATYGFRRSEALGLKWRSIDFESKTITICETLQQNTGGDYVGKTKTESSYRTLPMTLYIEKLLKNEKKHQLKNKSFLGSGYTDSDYVCVFSNGDVIHPNYLTVHFQRILEERGGDLPHVRLHDLRHSTASNLLAAGYSVVQVQEWMGHSSAATTLNFYAHVDAASKKNIAKGLDDMLDFGKPRK